MYGVFMRDQMKSYREAIQATITNTNNAIKHGKPNAKEIAGDGVLQGKELTKAKAAVKDLQKALAQLKPVFGGGGPILNTTGQGAGLGGGSIMPMYGIVFRDDLNKFRTDINGSIRNMNAAIADGQFKGEALKEAKAAIKYLKAAVKDLGTAQSSWPK